jgi:hypothetical protein
MHVDRAKFLVLTSSLFAACKEEAPPVAAPIVIPPQPPPTASVALYDASPPPLADAGKPEVPRAAEEDEEERDEYDRDIPLARSIHAATCPTADNQKGTTTCSLKMPSGACEGFLTVKTECAKLRTWLVPRAGEKVSACLTKKSGTEALCTYAVGSVCWMEALNSVCLDTSPKIEKLCRDAVSACDAVEKRYRHINQESCRAALSATVPRFHGKLTTCFAEGCDVASCYHMIGF